ncbi:coproporphyrinogen III oxidase [Bacillus spizizenii]|uniref:coproporphyrinogen III oxidase n=1 Tax=Bacillus spizizenii TaxID=96241 RepID=UPI000B52EE09|nr:coproporphyrinogen III oxidase [Bacillus spizizenii]MBK4205537.1 coproporphyrinogen III oxidase [Bacillus subtilis]OWV37653.1 coproporphyrinogen III oxidase [Bacillus spizizenii]
MQIKIEGIHDDRLHRPLQNIANLFYEECELVYGGEEPADIVISLDCSQTDEHVTVSGEVKGTVIKEQHTKSFSPGMNEKEAFKQVKNTISYVYLNLLQAHTGITQKWGILTGIRPTKLLHKKLQSGMPKAQAHTELKKDYLIHDEKIELMQEIVDRQLAAVPDLYQVKDEVSIYIGIPFCPTKCAYCTFPAYAIQGQAGRVGSFLWGLHYEMQKIGEWLKEHDVKVTTIYFGGGTPTSITAEEMDLLYEEMVRSFPDVKNIREITVEAGRPDTITEEKLAVLNKYDIDRISINPQSYENETLKAIGRHHTVEETIEKYHLSRRHGMNNINMDLIIGLPGEGVKEFRHSLSETEKLMPESLTVHTLSFKRASEMTRNKHKYKVAGREEVSQMMDDAVAWTKEHGYVPYYLYRQKNILGNLENVGYSLPGQESIYNIMIMEEVQTIIGIGCGAASKFIDRDTGKITHFANPKDPKSYNERFEHYTDEKMKYLEQIFEKTTKQH